MEFSKNILNTLRAKHWVKNLFCLVGLFFSGSALSLEHWLNVAPLLLSFCLTSSGGYVINDLANRKEDLKHPKKKNRLIASGKISFKTAIILIISCYSVSLSITILCYGAGNTLSMLVAYIVVNLTYTFLIRSIAVIDILTISFGFALRVAAGYYCIGLPPSEGLLLLTYQLALLLSLGKRKGELYSLKKSNIPIGETRSSLKIYSSNVSSILLIAIGVGTIITYIIYCINNRNGFPFLFTTLPVALGIFSYLRQAERSDTVEAPEKLLVQKSFLVINVLSWLLLSFSILYLFEA